MYDSQQQYLGSHEFGSVFAFKMIRKHGMGCVCALFIRSLIYYLVLEIELDNTEQPQFSNLIHSRELFKKRFVRKLNLLCHVTDHTGISMKGW